jgi:hypothetical protein
MASSTLRNQDGYPGTKKNHPVDAGHLLAIIRGQHLDNEAFVRQHLTECEQCRQSYAELMQTSRMLDVLGPMARYQRYPELSPVQAPVKARQSAPQQRSSSYRLPLRGVSLPVAVIPIIMAIAIVIALALVQIGKLPAPWYLPRNGSLIATNPALINEVQGHQPSPAAHPTQIATDVPGVTVTVPPVVTARPSPTSIASTKPFIEACKTIVEERYQVTAICGYHFPPEDKVTLYLSIYPNLKAIPLKPQTLVNRSGYFVYNSQDSFCMLDSVTIYAVDMMSKPPVNVVLYNISPPGCPVPGPTATPTSKPGPGGQ